jgi:TIR domain.
MPEAQYFFSYTRSDAEFVFKLASEIRDAGVNLWLDQLDIRGGQRWDRAVEDALAECQGMIAVLSPESVESNNVMDEISYALEADKTVVPILLRSCNIPFRLRRVQMVDFTESYSRGVADLLRALRIECRLEIIKPSPSNDLTQKRAGVEDVTDTDGPTVDKAADVHANDRAPHLVDATSFHDESPIISSEVVTTDHARASDERNLREKKAADSSNDSSASRDLARHEPKIAVAPKSRKPDAFQVFVERLAGDMRVPPLVVALGLFVILAIVLMLVAYALGIK